MEDKKMKNKSILLVMGVVAALVGQSVKAETVALAATNKSVRSVEANKPNHGQVRRAPLKFAEVEIVLSKQLSLADISGLPRAPRSDLEVLDGGQRVKVQLPASMVKALIEKGVEISLVRNFILFEGGGEGSSSDGDIIARNISAVDYIQGYNYSNYTILDNTPGAYSAVSPIDISGAPAGARVTFIDVDWEVYHQWPGDVVVFLQNERSGSPRHTLWFQDYHAPGYFGETVYSIPTFANHTVNQQWQLCGGDWAYLHRGYISDWWIRVYYQVPTDYCEASGGGDIYIGGVEVGTITNTGTGSDGYADYRASHSTEMEIGIGYPITVTNGHPYDEYDDCGIWVDWNQDLDFDDAGEQISVSGVSETFWATITPPPGAVLGDTCLRVRIWWGDPPAGPCGGSPYGEVEDYTITVGSAAPVACIVGGDRAIEEEGGCEARVILDGSCSSDADSMPGTNDDIEYFDWYEQIDPCDPNSDIFLGSGEIIECNLPLGEHDIILEVIDKAGAFDTNEVTITVEDTTPPEFSLSVMPDVLWPANHKMVEITPSWQVSDNCDEWPEVTLVSITMNEDGAAEDDIQVDDDGSIYLRAERSGKGNSRVYTITYQAVDDSGNVSIESAAVTVPHNKRKSK